MIWIRAVGVSEGVVCMVAKLLSRWLEGWDVLWAIGVWVLGTRRCVGILLAEAG